jgi:hypothetical protein
MKTHLYTPVFLVAIAFALTCCSNSLKFVPSTVVPGAEGTVKVKTDKNNNYAVNVNVQNLAEPNLLATPKATYVVWMETADHGTQNIGRLTSSQGLFSKARKGSLETVTPYRPIRFFITGEDRADAEYPASETVLTSESNNRIKN